VFTVRFGLDIFQESRCGDAYGARFTKDVARVDHAEIFRCKSAFVRAVGVDGTERESSEWVLEFGDVWGGVAKSCQDFS
jgi:hypothetical protein